MATVSKKKKTAKKKPATKKTTAKKPKTSAKKSTVKRTAIKASAKPKKVKASTKKTVAKKSTAKKSASTKAVAKKTRAKNATTKKKQASAKKVEAKTEKNLAEKITVKKRGPGRPPKKQEVVPRKLETAREKLVRKQKQKSGLKIERKSVAPEAKSTKPGTIPSPTKKELRTFRRVAADNKKRIKNEEKAKKKIKGFLAKPPSKGKKYSVDLRVHSPGTVGYFTAGGVEPGPALVRLAKVKGLDMVGLTDYYNPDYIDEVQASAANSSMTIIPGMDMCCQVEDCAEVYITTLFPETYTALELQEVLDELKVPESAKGRKEYCITTPFEQVLEIVEKRGGVVIPSRLDKTPYRQLAIPALVEKYGIHAFDLVHPENPEFFKKFWPSGGFTFFSFSNAHALAQIGSRAKKVKLQSPGFQGLKELVQRRIEG